MCIRDSVNGTKLTGEVRFVAREASAETRTFPVEIAFPNPDAAIPAGMTAQVELYAAPVATVTVPRSVITLNDSGQLGLRVVGADNLARFVAVEILSLIHISVRGWMRCWQRRVRSRRERPI